MRKEELIKIILSNERLQKYINNGNQDGVNLSILRHSEYDSDLVISLYRLFYKSGMDWVFVGNTEFFDYLLHSLELCIRTNFYKLFSAQAYINANNSLVRFEIWDKKGGEDAVENFTLSTNKNQIKIVNNYNNMIDNIEDFIKNRVENFTI